MTSYAKEMGLLVFSYLPSGIKTGFYRLMGARIGKGVRIGLGSYVLPFYSGFSGIEIGESAVIRDNVRICARSVKIGADCEIKEDSRISGEMSFSMGDRSYIDQGAIINLRRDVSMGSDACIGSRSAVYTHGVWLSALDGKPVRYGKVSIGDRAWVASNVFVMPGVSIGRDAICGAGSVVTRDVPGGAVVAGNPARIVRMQDPGRILPEERERLIADMFTEYMERYSDRIRSLETSEGYVSFIIRFQRKSGLQGDEETRVLYLRSPSGESVSGAFGRLHADRAVLVSSDIPLPMRESLEAQGVSWIDLGERSFSGGGVAVSQLVKSFENNGMRFSSRGKR